MGSPQTFWVHTNLNLKTKYALELTIIVCNNFTVNSYIVP